MEFLYKKLNIEYVEEKTGVDPRLIEAIKKGNTLEAIKVYREITNASFQDAKIAVEGLWAKYSG